MNVPIWTEEHVRASLPERDAESHKGTYGTALLLAGSNDMPGAASCGAWGDAERSRKACHRHV